MRREPTQITLHRWNYRGHALGEVIQIEGNNTRRRHIYTNGTFTQWGHRVYKLQLGAFPNVGQPSVLSLSALLNSKSNKASWCWNAGPSSNRCRFCYWDSKATGLALPIQAWFHRRGSAFPGPGPDTFPTILSRTPQPYWIRRSAGGLMIFARPNLGIYCI